MKSRSLLWLTTVMILLLWNLHGDTVNALVKTSFKKFQITSWSSVISTSTSLSSAYKSFNNLYMSSNRRRKDNAISHINGKIMNNNQNNFLRFNFDMKSLDGSSSTSNKEKDMNKISRTQLSAVSSTLDTTSSSSSSKNKRKQSGDNNNTVNKFENSNMKLGILLLNLGGPETQQDVEGFLYNLFADPDIIRLPPGLSLFQKPLAMFIAKRRAPKSREAYQSIGGGSPIVAYTSEQASLIEKELATRGLPSKAYFAMRYWHPFTEDVLGKFLYVLSYACIIHMYIYIHLSLFVLHKHAIDIITYLCMII